MALDKLKRDLKNLGIEMLSSLVGEGLITTLEEIHKISVTTYNLADLLFDYHGYNILANFQIRRALLEQMSGEDYAAICNENYKKDALLERRIMQWKRTSKIENLIKYYELNEQYLPPFQEYQDEKSVEEIIPEKHLYPYQKRMKDRIISFLMEGKKSFLVHMPTGAGKTRTSLEAVVDYWRLNGSEKQSILWLTDSEELCDQARETFSSLWKAKGDFPIKILSLWGQHDVEREDIDGSFIVASLQKMNKYRFSQDSEKFAIISKIKVSNGLIIVDEAHKSIAKTYKETIEYFQGESSALVGLTATPGRTDLEETEELVRFYGNEKISLEDENRQEIDDPIEYLQKDKYLSFMDYKEVETDIRVHVEKSKLGLRWDISDQILRDLSKNSQRNLLIIDEVCRLVKENKPVIVFSCSVEHAKVLHAILKLKGISNLCVDCETPLDQRREGVKKFKNGDIDVIVNYGVLTTGFDAPRVEAVLVARPTLSIVLYSQMIGRGIRGSKMGGTDRCEIIQIKDDFVGNLSESQAFLYFDDYWKKGDTTKC